MKEKIFGLDKVFNKVINFCILVKVDLFVGFSLNNNVRCKVKTVIKIFTE